MITLTVAEIIDLACAAGLTLNQRFIPDEDELETEISITKCPAGGVGEEGEPDKAPEHYRYVAYYSEYPEEGCIGLGPAIATTPDAEAKE